MLFASITKMMALSLRTNLQRAALALGLLVAFAWNARAAVSLGIDELEKSNFAVLQGKRVGLVTNPSGADSHGRSAVDVLYHGSGFHLVKLFGPEHGLYGVVGAGKAYGDMRDRRTGLPVYALYNTPDADHRHPTAAMRLVSKGRKRAAVKASARRSPWAIFCARRTSSRPPRRSRMRSRLARMGSPARVSTAICWKKRMRWRRVTGLP